jgi:hypothetical protein
MKSCYLSLQIYLQKIFVHFLTKVQYVNIVIKYSLLKYIYNIFLKVYSMCNAILEGNLAPVGAKYVKLWAIFHFLTTFDTSVVGWHCDRVNPNPQCP